MKYLPLILLLTGCPQVELPQVDLPPIQIDAYSCVNGWQYHLDGTEIVDSTGAQLTCTNQ